MPLSDKISVITQAYVDLLRSKWEELGLAGPEDVYYGDQARYPRTPSIAVFNSSLERQLSQTGMQARVSVSTWIMIFHMPLKDASAAQKETDEYAEKVEQILHSDRKLGGLLIHSHVARNEPGAAERGGTLLRATRLSVSGLSQTRIGG